MVASCLKNSFANEKIQQDIQQDITILLCYKHRISRGVCLFCFFILQLQISVCVCVCVCVLNLPLSAFLQETAERLTLFTAEEEIFAFQRTVSRIMEMQTEKYWKEGDRSIGKKPT